MPGGFEKSWRIHWHKKCYYTSQEGEGTASSAALSSLETRSGKTSHQPLSPLSSPVFPISSRPCSLHSLPSKLLRRRWCCTSPGKKVSASLIRVLLPVSGHRVLEIGLVKSEQEGDEHSALGSPVTVVLRHAVPQPKRLNSLCQILQVMRVRPAPMPPCWSLSKWG